MTKAVVKKPQAIKYPDWNPYSKKSFPNMRYIKEGAYTIEDFSTPELLVESTYDILGFHIVDINLENYYIIQEKFQKCITPKVQEGIYTFTKDKLLQGKTEDESIRNALLYGVIHNLELEHLKSAEFPELFGYPVEEEGEEEEE